MDGAFRVGDWQVEPQLNTIADGTRTIHLEPKVMRVLVYLAEHLDGVTTKERLIHAVWPDAFVTDDVLTHAISELRRAFGDDAREPRFIQTVPKGGYRLIAPVNRSSAGSERAPEESEPVRKNRALAGLMAVLLAGVVAALLRSHGEGHGHPIDSLAVLPFVSDEGGPDDEYLGDGITESLIESLARIPGLRVMSRTSAFRYKRQYTDPKTAGRELGVRAVLTGTVRVRQQIVSVHAELVDTHDDRHLWGESYAREMSEILDVPRDIARQIADTLRPRLTGDDQKRLTRGQTTNAEAYRAYLKGRYYWNKRTGPTMRTAVQYFHQAIERDPEYALAHAGLADAYVLNYQGLPPKDAMPMGKTAATRALQIDPQLAEAHGALGVVACAFDWDLAAAETRFKQAIALNPNYATAYGWYGQCLGSWGRLGESLEATRRAQELDPVSLVISVQVGNSFVWARRYDEALDQYRKTLEMDASFWLARYLLAKTYELKGMHAEAVAEYLKSEGDQPERVAALKGAYAARGWRGFWQAYFDMDRRSAQDPSLMFDRAVLAVRLGQKDGAFPSLEKAYELRGNMPAYISDPLLDSLRPDPRFADLARRVGFPP